nr:von Willebrand factor C domain-containing protein 2-like [Biomphalaria glabrata]
MTSCMSVVVLVLVPLLFRGSHSQIVDVPEIILQATYEEPLTAPPGCEDLPRPDFGPCANCDCVVDAGVAGWECSMVDCFDVPCVDKIPRPELCCADECPNGPNCAVNGVIISVDEVKLINGSKCYCVYEIATIPPRAVCDPITTTPKLTTRKITTTKSTTTRATTRKITTPKPTTTRATTTKKTNKKPIGKP